MATAVVDYVKNPVSKTVVQDVIKLELSPEEAQILLALTKFVRGNEVTTYRRETDAIGKALNEAKIFAFAGRYFSGTVTAYDVDDDE